MITRGVLVFSSLLILTAATTAASQSATPSPSPSPSPKECDFPVASPVDLKPKMSAKPNPKFTMLQRETYRARVMTLRATLCGSGKVTDIAVTDGLTPEMNTAAIDAAKLIRFTPAEKDGKKVSRPVILKYIVKD